jgi:hypothetical protein
MFGILVIRMIMVMVVSASTTPVVTLRAFIRWASVVVAIVVLLIAGGADRAGHPGLGRDFGFDSREGDLVHLPWLEVQKRYRGLGGLSASAGSHDETWRVSHRRSGQTRG